MNIVYLDAGNVAYSETEAAVPLTEFIVELLDAKRAGATHIVGLSGNHRGPKYVTLGMPATDQD